MFLKFTNVASYLTNWLTNLIDEFRYVMSRQTERLLDAHHTETMSVGLWYSNIASTSLSFPDLFS